MRLRACICVCVYLRVCVCMCLPAHCSNTRARVCARASPCMCLPAYVFACLFTSIFHNICVLHTCVSVSMNIFAPIHSGRSVAVHKRQFKYTASGHWLVSRIPTSKFRKKVGSFAILCSKTWKFSAAGLDSRAIRPCATKCAARPSSFLFVLSCYSRADRCGVGRTRIYRI